MKTFIVTYSDGYKYEVIGADSAGDALDIAPSRVHMNAHKLSARLVRTDFRSVYSGALLV